MQNPPGWSGGINVKDSSGAGVPTTTGPSHEGVLSWRWPTKRGVTYTVNYAA